MADITYYLLDKFCPPSKEELKRREKVEAEKIERMRASPHYGWFVGYMEDIQAKQAKQAKPDSDSSEDSK